MMSIAGHVQGAPGVPCLPGEMSNDIVRTPGLQSWDQSCFVVRSSDFAFEKLGVLQGSIRGGSFFYLICEGPTLTDFTVDSTVYLLSHAIPKYTPLL